VPNPVSKDSIPPRRAHLHVIWLKSAHGTLLSHAYIAKFMDSRGAEQNLIWRSSNFNVARESNDECVFMALLLGFVVMTMQPHHYLAVQSL
jgi:hypothetical protein